MGDTVVGMMFSHNEGDILAEILENCLDQVDAWFISSDNSTDNCWDIIQDFQRQHPDKIEYIRNHRDDPRDIGQRQSMLEEIRKRYKPENTWVQALDADMMFLDTDVKQAIKDFAHKDIAVTWLILNAVRKPGTWSEVDTYPLWGASIKEVMPYAHPIENGLYTFRPLHELSYDLDTWKPWPRGFGHYIQGEKVKKKNDGPHIPILAHYGYRGPKHYYRYHEGQDITKYPWKTGSLQEVEDTVFYFNGVWNQDLMLMSRESWLEWRKVQRGKR